MNKKLLKCILALAVLAAITACTRPEPNVESHESIPEEDTDMAYGYDRPRRINPSRARAMMHANPDAIILDVRTRQEFDEERIPGAVLLPYDSVAQYAPEVLPHKDAIILVYCRSGRRSLIAAKELVAMGYTNVYEFGGILSWPYERE